MVPVIFRCIGGIDWRSGQEWVLAERNWMARWCEWSEWMQRIFRKPWTVVEVCSSLQSLNPAVSVPDPDPELLVPHSFWGPEVPWWSRSRMRLGWCGSRALLLFRKSAWGQLCHGSLCWFSDWFPHCLAFYFHFLCCMLNVTFNLLTQI